MEARVKIPQDKQDFCCCFSKFNFQIYFYCIWRSRQKERSFIHQLTHQMPARAKVGLVFKAGDPELNLAHPHGGQGLRCLSWPLQEAGLEVKQLGLEPGALIKDSSISSGSLPSVPQSHIETKDFFISVTITESHLYWKPQNEFIAKQIIIC